MEFHHGYIERNSSEAWFQPEHSLGFASVKSASIPTESYVAK